VDERTRTPAAAAAAPPALYLLCAALLACAAAFVPTLGVPVAEDFMAPRELLLQGAAIGVALLCLARARAARLTAEDLCLAGFALLGLVSYRVVGTNAWLGGRAFGITWSGVAVFWCARALAREGWGDALLRTAAAAAAFLALTALVEAYGGVRLSLPGRAPGGVLGHRNSAAHLLVLALPLLALLALEARRRATLSLACAAAAMAACVIVLSRSRGAWIAAAALGALALALPLTRPGGRAAFFAPRVKALAAALALGVAAAILLPNLLGWRSDAPEAETLRHLTDYSSGSGHGRVVQYGRTLRMIADHPLLGVGPGNWSIEYPRYAAPADPSFRPGDLVPTTRLPSGDWLGLAAERGIPALLLLLLAGGAIARRSARRWRADADADADPGERRRALVILCVLAGLLVLGTFDPVLLQPLHAFFLCGVVGALAPPGRPWRTLALGPGARRTLAFAFVLVAIAPLVVSVRQLRSTTLLARTGPSALPRALRASPGDYRLQALMAVHWVAAHRCDRARPHIRAAHALFPAAPAPRDMEARCAAEPPVAQASTTSSSEEVASAIQ
jgi:O-antigen ligase